MAERMHWIWTDGWRAAWQASIPPTAVTQPFPLSFPFPRLPSVPSFPLLPVLLSFPLPFLPLELGPLKSS